jgi:hypothetical protein
MLVRHMTICAAMLLGVTALAANSAQALSSKECSAKYKAAKEAGTLNGMKWNDFRKAQCGADAAAEPAPAPAPPPPSEAKAPPATPAAKPAAPPPVVTGNIMFPPAVSSKYSAESAGKARMHTCRDQYEANKANSANGGLKWIQKGGGYYSECNKHLKGQA